METLTCPRCGTPMEERGSGHARIRRCPEGHGVFLERAALGDLIDAEVAWHRHADAYHTAPLPRITADMTSPPAARPAAPAAWVASLFD